MSLVFMVLGCTTPDEPVVTPRYAWVVGDTDSTGYGAIYHTTDGGVTFSRQGVGQEALKDVHVLDAKAIDSKHVIAVCSKNRIVRTNDGGATWTSALVPANNPECELYCISIVGGSTIYVSGSYGTVYVSQDSGTSWTSANVPGLNEAQFQGVVALTPQRAYICGNVPVADTLRIGVVYQTVDAGKTWQQVLLPNRYDSVHRWISGAAYGNTVMIYGETNYYSVSTDNGTTWRNDSTPIGGAANGADINHLIMLSESTWMAAMDMGHLIRTDNAGKNWNDVRPGLGASFMLGIDAFNTTHAIACGETSNYPQLGSIVYTTDGGSTWTKSFSKTGPFRKVTAVP